MQLCLVNKLWEQHKFKIESLNIINVKTLSILVKSEPALYV